MHLVFINQYYPPDLAPTGWMLEAVAEELVRGGHRVTVICAAGGYAEEGGKSAGRPMQNAAGGPEVIRIGATGFGRKTFSGKLLDYLSFYLWVAWRLAFLG